METKRIIFIGSVQGVGFRFTVMNVANRLQLKGCVKNLPDRSVEMVVQGHPDDIDLCVADIKETYPANITEVISQPVESPKIFDQFKITF